MRIENINLSKNNQSYNVKNNKDMEFENIVNQDIELKVDNQEDSLEMLNKDRNKFNDMNNIYSKEQEIISNIQVSEMLIYRTNAILGSIRDITKKALDDRISFEDRVDLQTEFDSFVKDISNISYNIERRLGIDEYDPENLGIEGVLSLAKMGKVTIKSRYGKSERISVIYTGKQNRSVIIDVDKNTGDIGMNLRKNQKEEEKYLMKNLEMKEILESKGYIVEIEDDGNDEIVQEGVVEFKKSDEVVGLNIMTTDAAMETLKEIDKAIESVEKSNDKIISFRDKLEISVYNKEKDTWERDIKDKDEAMERMDRVKDHIYEKIEFREYINRVQNPEIVYHLLR